MVRILRTKESSMPKKMLEGKIIFDKEKGRSKMDRRHTKDEGKQMERKYK